MTRRTCFISAKYGTDLSALQRALEANHIDWQWAQNLPSNVSLSSSVLSAISKAQFLLAVASEDLLTANVWFEIGYAVGQEVPVVLLSTGKIEVPLDMSSIRHLQTDIGDEKLLTFQIELLLKSLKEPKLRTIRSSRTPQKSGLGLGSASLATYASELEQSVANEILLSGGRVTIPDFSDAKQPADLLMWLPEQDKDFFNPAAIEIKARVTTERFEIVQRNLSFFVRQSGFGCGLVVIDDALSFESARKATPVPLVFVIFFADIKRELGRGKFGSWIRMERNRLAHGVR